jgi:uncharacterized protein YbbC (DUF1343 family)
MGTLAKFRRTRGSHSKYPVFIKVLIVSVVLIGLGVTLGKQIPWWRGTVKGASEGQQGVSEPNPPAVVRLGIENIDAYMDVFKGKRVGLITNATGVDRNYIPSSDALGARVNLVALYAPEHGLRGNVVAGAAVPHEKDFKTGLPIYSLHGDTRKPSAAMLKNIDVLAFDIQDIGARSYTYIYTMAYAMQSAKENNITFVVFDRPNPIGGEAVEGGLLKSAHSSFIGLYPIPIRHGLTVGELAKLFNEEFGIGARLVVIPMSGWKRNMLQTDTGLPWIMTSPNIPTQDSALIYSGTGLFGGSNVSEGIGTTRPFELVGAPWLDGLILASRMNSLKLPGVYFRPAFFTPQWGKYQGRVCNGVQIHIIDRRSFSPVAVGIHLLSIIRELGGTQFKWNTPTGKDPWMIDLYEGGTELRQGRTPSRELLTRWEREAKAFQIRTAKYRLYP